MLHETIQSNLIFIAFQIIPRCMFAFKKYSLYLHCLDVVVLWRLSLNVDHKPMKEPIYTPSFYTPSFIRPFFIRHPPPVNVLGVRSNPSFSSHQQFIFFNAQLLTRHRKKNCKKYIFQGGSFCRFFVILKAITLGSPTMVTKSSYWNLRIWAQFFN